MQVDNNIQKLRELMRQHQIDACYIGTQDPHNSEYVAPYFRTRAFMSGFSGSAGTMIVTLSESLVFVDGRYYIQADQETKDSEVKVMKLGMAGVPAPLTWLAQNLKPFDTLALEGDLYPDATIAKMESELAEKHIKFLTDIDLISSIWTERPALPKAPVFVHDLKYAGEKTSAKLAKVRAKMAEAKADYALYSGLDDNMWLLNIRGGDVPKNPVALSFVLIGRDFCKLFIDLAKVSAEVSSYLENEGVSCADYFSLASCLSQLKAGKIVLCRKNISRNLVKALPADVEIIDEESYPHHLKAVLNQTQIDAQLACSSRDSFYVTEYIYYLKTQAVKNHDNEFSAQEVLHDLRKDDPLFLDESFETISAYGANAAMMHYSASAEKHTDLAAKGLYLVDCGVQMLDGTTDITRTISLGELQKEEKTAYTLTLKSHIALASAPFLKGTAGTALDTIARSVMWRHNSDYKCGTGHGFAFVGGVHEGPQRLTGNPKFGNVPFEPGMMITIEPGVYKEGKFGVRLENDYLVSKKDFPVNDQGDVFYAFTPYVFVPFDRAAILPEMLSDEELSYLNAYHQKVREVLLSQCQDEALKNFIVEETAPLAK